MVWALRTRKGLTQIIGNVHVRYCPIVRCSAGTAQSLVRPSERYVEEKQTELETESK